MHGTASELQVAVGESNMHAKCMQPIRTIESDMTIGMQKAWDPSVKQSKPIVGEGGNQRMGSGKTQPDSHPRVTG